MTKKPEPISIEKLVDFEKIIKEKDKVIFDFFAIWCGPCQYISPIFNAMIPEFPEVTFCKIDVDKAEEICQKERIECMPTFIAFEKGKEKERISGADGRKIRKILEKMVGRKTPEGEIDSLEDFEKCLEENEKVVVDFFAEWCGPCQRISPLFHELKKKYSGIKFIKSNADEARAIYSKYGVNCMPTFITFRGGVEEERMSGASPDRLEALIDELNEPATPPDNIKGHEHPMKEKNIMGFFCEKCYFQKNEKMKAYHCKECKIYICGDCKEKIEKDLPIEKNKDIFMAPKAHKHGLFRIQRPCMCDLCRTHLSESYCCERCDFDLCEECFKKNQ